MERGGAGAEEEAEGEEVEGEKEVEEGAVAEASDEAAPEAAVPEAKGPDGTGLASEGPEVEAPMVAAMVAASAIPNISLEKAWSEMSGVPLVGTGEAALVAPRSPSAWRAAGWEVRTEDESEAAEEEAEEGLAGSANESA